MTPMDRTWGRADRSSTAMRRPAAASLLLAIALMAGACEDATQEDPVGTTGTPEATDAAPGRVGGRT